MDIILHINGEKFGGWEQVNVGLGIEQIAGSFTLSLTDRWDEGQQARPIKAGSSCQLLIGSQTVITGHIDSVAPEYDAGTHIISVSGRDATADLVDSSAVHGSGQWTGRNLLQIATDLCSPFAISVQADTDVGAPFRTWKIQEGETVFECIERAARIRGVLLVTDGKGNLNLTRAGSGRTSTALVLGENIKRASGGFDHKDRFSKITVKGDHAGSDDAWGEQVTERAASARDDNRITRHRPLIILAEDQVDNAECAQRARWEINRRFGASLSRAYTVQGWTQDNGELWPINQRVRVRDVFAGLDAELLISAVSFNMDDNGSETEITVTRPEAFDLIPMKEKVEKKEAVESWAL